MRRLATFSKRQTNSFGFGPTCSYQTTFELVRKVFLKLLPFKIKSLILASGKVVTFMFGPFP